MSDLAQHLDLETGAFRAEHFRNELQAALSRARREGQPLSVVWLDVDELQEANDLHGREAVDAQLQRLCARVGAVLDGAGPIGRLAPGTFAVFLEGWASAAAIELGEQLHRALHREPQPRLLASIGIAEARVHEPLLNLLEAAEAACVKAKQQGRDAVAAR